jgi:hypothetical protein
MTVSALSLHERTEGKVFILLLCVFIQYIQHFKARYKYTYSKPVIAYRREQCLPTGGTRTTWVGLPDHQTLKRVHFEAVLVPR